jgi:hypothetical protein
MLLLMLFLSSLFIAILSLSLTCYGLKLLPRLGRYLIPSTKLSCVYIVLPMNMIDTIFVASFPSRFARLIGYGPRFLSLTSDLTA